jgi:hypothetical protein
LSSPEQKRKELARYRIKQADESLDEARFLLSGGRSPRSIMNRLYYAMFYSVLALLIYEPYSSSKHSGVVGYFNKSFILSSTVLDLFGLSFQRNSLILFTAVCAQAKKY